MNNSTGGRVLAINYRTRTSSSRDVSRLPQGLGHHQRRSRDRGRHLQVDRRGDTWKKLSAGLPGVLIGTIDIDVARSSPSTVYAMVEAPGAEGGLYRSNDSGATWKLVNSAANLRSRPFYFHYVDVNPKNPEEVWVNALGLFKSTNGGQSFTTVSTPHGDNHGIWFNPDNPLYAIQCNDGGANVTTDGGRTWSSILNQPTAEIYMVSVDERHPYNLYGPQQDNSTVVVPSCRRCRSASITRRRRGRRPRAARPAASGRRPTGRSSRGACKGEVERFNVETGQSQGRRSINRTATATIPTRSSPASRARPSYMVSPHNPKVVYQASHVLHRTMDDGVTWDVISPDLTAHEKEYRSCRATRSRAT